MPDLVHSPVTILLYDVRRDSAVTETMEVMMSNSIFLA